MGKEEDGGSCAFSLSCSCGFLVRKLPPPAFRRLLFGSRTEEGGVSLRRWQGAVRLGFEEGRKRLAAVFGTRL